MSIDNTIILTALAVVSIAAISVTIYMKRKYQRPTDYRSIFYVGVVLMITSLAGNTSLVAVGVIFTILGLKNKSKWEENRFRWSQLSKEEKNMKIIFLTIFLLTFIGAGSILLINQA